jgi:hypothetical protein
MPPQRLETKAKFPRHSAERARTAACPNSKRGTRETDKRDTRTRHTTRCTNGARNRVPTRAVHERSRRTNHLSHRERRAHAHLGKRIGGAGRGSRHGNAPAAGAGACGGAEAGCADHGRGGPAKAEDRGRLGSRDGESRGRGGHGCAGSRQGAERVGGGGVCETTSDEEEDGSLTSRSRNGTTEAGGADAATGWSCERVCPSSAVRRANLSGCESGSHRVLEARWAAVSTKNGGPRMVLYFRPIVLGPDARSRRKAGPA